MFITAILLASLCLRVLAAAEEQREPKSEILSRSSTAWNGVPYTAYTKGIPELAVLKITIPPHSKLKWHTHPIPSVAYILSGDITVEVPRGNHRRHFVAGQVVPETVNTQHRGVTTDQPAVLIVFYAGAKGMLLTESGP